jgi:hypothetical protein
VKLQEGAKHERRGGGSDEPRPGRNMAVGQEEEVHVVSIWDPITLTIQFTGEEFAKVQRGIRETLPLLSKPPMENDWVVVQMERDDRLLPYRARIEEISHDSPKATVYLLDFGYAVEAGNRFFQCPKELAAIPPQAKSVTLGCLEVLDPSEEAIDFVWSLCHNSVLFAHMMYEDWKPCVLLTDAPEITSGSLNAFLISKGIARFTPHAVPSQFMDLVESLKAL